MQVILLQRIGRLGQMGDVVTVKDGYARNFLLPQHKALRATKDNREKFESQRVTLEANNLELKKEAEAVGAKLEGKTFVAIRQAGEIRGFEGVLYGMHEKAGGQIVTLTQDQRDAWRQALDAIYPKIVDETGGTSKSFANRSRWNRSAAPWRVLSRPAYALTRLK